MHCSYPINLYNRMLAVALPTNKIEYKFEVVTVQCLFIRIY